MHGTININLTAYSCICYFIEYIVMHGTINIKYIESTCQKPNQKTLPSIAVVQITVINLNCETQIDALT